MTAGSLSFDATATGRTGGSTLPVVPPDMLAADRVREVPLTMPTEQEYYWHFEWQQAEREALAERDAGESVRFDSDDPEDIVRWLNEPDDE